jgi:chitin deacetylase
VPGEDEASVRAAIQTALKGSQTPGVTLLEHELNNNTVGFFEEYYPSLDGLGWKPQAVSDHFGWSWYANAADNDDTPFNVTSIDAVTVAAAKASNTTNVATSSSNTSSTASSSSASSSKQSSTAGTNGASRPLFSSAAPSLYASAFAALMAILL